MEDIKQTNETVYVLLRCHDQYEYSEPHTYASAEPTRSVEAVFTSRESAENERDRFSAIEIDTHGDPDSVEPDKYGYTVWGGDTFEIVEQQLRV